MPVTPGAKLPNVLEKIWGETESGNESNQAQINIMSSCPSNEASGLPPMQGFTTTHWSVVLAAGHPSSPDAREALDKLCRSYWYPLYAFVRRQGCPVEEAE